MCGYKLLAKSLKFIKIHRMSRTITIEKGNLFWLISFERNAKIAAKSNKNTIKMTETISYESLIAKFHNKVYNNPNSTQHAFQRCGPRWVIFYC